MYGKNTSKTTTTEYLYQFPYWMKLDKRSYKKYINKLFKFMYNEILMDEYIYHIENFKKMYNKNNPIDSIQHKLKIEMINDGIYKELDTAIKDLMLGSNLYTKFHLNNKENVHKLIRMMELIKEYNKENINDIQLEIRHKYPFSHHPDYFEVWIDYIYDPKIILNVPYDIIGDNVFIKKNISRLTEREIILTPEQYILKDNIKIRLKSYILKRLKKLYTN